MAEVGTTAERRDTGIRSVDTRRPSRPPSWWLRLSGLVVGPAAISLGTIALPTANGLLRAALVVVGLALAAAALGTALRAVFGESFQLTLWLCGIWVAVIVMAAAVADLLPLAEARDPSLTLRTPGLLRPDLFSGHPLGTDRQGLDILGELVYGTRVSLVIGIGATAFGLLIGGLVGLVAGYKRGRLDAAIGILTDTLLAFPPLILLLALVAVMGPSVRNVTIALGVLSVPAYIRLVRANTIAFSQREFVTVAEALGARPRWIMSRELLPNVAPAAISYGLIISAVLIVAEASLSYLGLSVQRPNPTWGNLIASGQADYRNHPHLVVAPGLVLFATVYALNRLGEAARKRWDNRANQLTT